MDMKTISLLKPLELFDVVNKLQNIITNESGLAQFIQFAKNMEEMRKKWQKAEERAKELEILLKQANLDKSTLNRQVNELKIDIEMHYEKRMKAESERDKLQKQIEMFKKILDDKQSYTMNDEERNFLLFNTPNFNHHQHNSTKRLSHNIHNDDTGSLIDDFTEDDLEDDVIDNNNNNNDDNDLHDAAAAAGACNIPIITTTTTTDDTNRAVPTSSRRSGRHRPPTSPKILNTSVGRNSKRQKGSLTRQDTSEQKRSRTRSHDGPNRELLAQGSSGAAITAITTLKLSDDGRPITLTSEIQHNSAAHNGVESPLEQATHKYESNNGNNKLEVSFVRPKTKKKRPSREFLQRSADESESADSDVFWNSETATKQLNNIDRRLLTPIVETPNVVKLPKENLNKHNNLKNVNSSPLITNMKKSRKAHSFKSHVLISSETCGHCDKRARFGKVIFKCRDCDLVVHQECKELIDRPCYLPLNFPMQGSISDYVTNEAPYVPIFLQYIIAEIENRGIGKEVGLYRVNGSDTQIKQFREKLIKRHQLPDLRKINDVHVLCGFVKEFLNNLNEHLITYELWPRFAKAIEIENNEDKANAFKYAINELPRANRDTLAFMILHLQRISLSQECKMGITNLSYVLAPSIVGNSAPNMSSAQIIHEIKIQHHIVENLLTISSQFYDNIISNVNDAKLVKNAPNTPEILRKSRTATVLTSLLGPAVNNIQFQQRENIPPAPSSAIKDQNNIRARRNNYNQQQKA